MEFGLKRSSGGQLGDGVIKEEKRSESNGGDHEAPSHRQEPENTAVDQGSPMKITARSIVETAPSTATSTKKEEVDELESARAEMGEVREENQRLKMCLDRIMKEYQALQMQFHVIVQQETKDHQIMSEESTEELVSLSLGRLPIMNNTNNIPKSEDKTKVTTTSINNKRARSSSVQDHEEEEELKEDELALGLDCKFETSKSGSTTDQANNNNNSNAISPSNSSQIVAKEDEAAESWPPSKVLKNNTNTSNNNNAGDRDRDHSGDQDEVSQQNPAKKARVCVRARCDTPTMNDGCQWRKYGQKISKGNPCPRAYYRCTVAPNCPVRKQVQRCADDMSILITTYEGTHNHPLPLSATAMASTTSAAASMLLSGSSSSSINPANANAIASSSSMIMPSSTSSSATLHNNNFYFSDSIMKPRQFYLSNPALSPSPSHPTITLDLTNPNHYNNILPSSSNKFLTPSSSSSSHNNSNNYIHVPPPRFPASSSTNTLSFTTSSSELPNALGWTNNGFLTYNNQLQPYAHHHTPNINILGRQVPIMPIMPPSHHQNSNSLPADTIAAATKVITADPSFQSALAAALTSIIGTTGTTNNISSNTTTSSSGITTQQGGLMAENLGFNKIHSKWGDHQLFPASFTKTASSGSTHTAGSSSSLMFLQPSLGFSASKNASAAASLSPGDNHNHNNNNRDNSNS